MPKVTLSDVSNLSGAESTAIATINANHDAIETGFDNTLSRDGSSPNSMLADIDLNSNDLLNGGTITGTSLVGTDITVNGTSLGTQVTAAATSATNAANSASAASTSETNASASETNAANSASAASTSETNAANSASAASTSETNASTSETNAANSASAASTSETNASTSETNAASSASAASTSETNASASETNAANSASAASTSETNASASETNAANSASAASTSETNAASSASAAAASAIDAGMNWRDDWVTSTAYEISDTVRSADYGSYICTSDHTSGATTEPGVGASWSDKWDIVAEDGNDGAPGFTPGLKYQFNGTNTDADPGNGYVRQLHGGSFATTTHLLLDNLDSDGATVSGIVDTWDDVLNATAKGYLNIYRANDSTVWRLFSITGTITDESGYRKIPVAPIASAGGLSNDDNLVIHFTQSGADGAGSGDVVGPASAVNNNLVAFDTTTGKLIKDSGKAYPSGDVVGTSDTQTLTNKTFDADGTGNSITNIENADIKSGAAIDAAKIHDGTVSNTEFGYLNGVTSAIQTQIDGKAASSHSHSGADITSGTLADARISESSVTQHEAALAGYQTLNFPIGSHIRDETSPPGYLKIAETTTNKVHYEYMEFDGAGSSKEYTHFSFTVPKGVDESTADIQFHVIWTSTATDTDSAVFGLQILAAGDGDALDAAYGTAQEVTDAAQSTSGDQYTTAWSGNITPAGTLAEGDRLYCRFYRDPGDGSDTMAEDARVIEVVLRIKHNTLKDD